MAEEELGFTFEPPSDEEIDDYANQSSDSDSEQQEHNQQASSEEENDDVVHNKKKQSPWDFSSFTESVADEHARRSTTSIDYKISKAIQQLAISIPKDDEDDVDEKPDRQVISRSLMCFMRNCGSFC